jgi:hypothetical protein
MTLEEARGIMADMIADDRLYFSGPHEYGPSEPRKWRLEGDFSLQQLEALAIVLRARETGTS